MSAPMVGAVLVDTSRDDRVGEFRGIAGPYWSLRPVCGGAEWEAEPESVRTATPAERLGAIKTGCRARPREPVVPTLAHADPRAHPSSAHPAAG